MKTAISILSGLCRLTISRTFSIYIGVQSADYRRKLCFTLYESTPNCNISISRKRCKTYTFTFQSHEQKVVEIIVDNNYE